MMNKFILFALVLLLACQAEKESSFLVSHILITQDDKVDSICITYNADRYRKIDQHWRFRMNSNDPWLSGLTTWEMTGDSLKVSHQTNYPNDILNSIFAIPEKRYYVRLNEQGFPISLTEKNGDITEYFLDDKGILRASLFREHSNTFQYEDTLVYENDLHKQISHSANSGAYEGFKNDLNNGFWRLQIKAYDQKPYFVSDPFVRWFMMYNYNYYWHKNNPTLLIRDESRKNGQTLCNVEIHYTYQNDQVQKFTEISKSDINEDDIKVTHVLIKYQ